MSTITVNISDEEVNWLRSVSKKKGEMGQTITKALQKLREEREQKEIAKRAIARLKKGFAMGFKPIPRDQLYEEMIAHRWKKRSS